MDFTKTERIRDTGRVGVRETEGDQDIKNHRGRHRERDRNRETDMGADSGSAGHTRRRGRHRLQL